MSDSPPRDARNHRTRPVQRRKRPDENGDVAIDRELLAELDREEPLSLAEELDKAAERVRRIGAAIAKDDAHDRNIHIAELQRMSVPELIATAEAENVPEVSGLKKQELIFRILKERVKLKGLMYGEGTLEILPDGFGFLRSPDYHYLSCPDDIYVSPSQIRRFGLRNGNTVAGTIRPPKENERYFALLRVEAINGDDPNLLAKKIFFDDLTPVHPDQRIVMETTPDEVAMRVVDMIVPIGFGQRGLIVSPPRAGKTILLQKMAKSVLTNYPEAYVIMLLIDERPEEVTDMERQIKGPHCEVISSTFDETSCPPRAGERDGHRKGQADGRVRQGRHHLPGLDHAAGPRLERRVPALGQNSFRRHRRQRHAAAQAVLRLGRKVEDGGSLTIVATALVDTGSKMDEVIFEEFKGTGNQEIVLDRRLVDRRIWPSIDITRSGTRKEEMLMDPEEHRRICLLRRVLHDMNPTDAMELLTTRLQKTKTNAEFLMSVKE